MKDKTEEDSFKPRITLEHIDAFFKAVKYDCDCDRGLEYLWKKEAERRGITVERLEELNETDTIFLWCSGSWCSGPAAFVISKNLHRRLHNAVFKVKPDEDSLL